MKVDLKVFLPKSFHRNDKEILHFARFFELPENESFDFFSFCKLVKQLFSGFSYNVSLTLYGRPYLSNI